MSCAMGQIGLHCGHRQPVALYVGLMPAVEPLGTSSMPINSPCCRRERYPSVLSAALRDGHGSVTFGSDAERHRAKLEMDGHVLPGGCLLHVVLWSCIWSRNVVCVHILLLLQYTSQSSDLTLPRHILDQPVAASCSVCRRAQDWHRPTRRHASPASPACASRASRAARSACCSCCGRGA